MKLFRILQSLLSPITRTAKFLGRLIPFGKGLGKLSVAARVAWLLFFFVLMFLIAALCLQLIGIGGDFWKFWGRGWNSAIVFAAVFGIPLFAYIGIRLLTLDVPTLYPEIDESWEKGTAWIGNRTLQISEVPIFLVLGTPHFSMFRNFHASAERTGADEIPSGDPDWLHWFGDSNALFLHLTQCCESSQAYRSCLKTVQRSGGMVDHSRTLEAPDAIGMFDSISMADGGNVAANPESFAAWSLTPEDMAASSFEQHAPVTAATSNISEQPSGDDDWGERLKYVCDLFRRASKSEVSPNGLIILLPFNGFLDDRQFTDLCESVFRDILSVQENLQTSLPVTIVFTGMENEKGFARLHGIIGEAKARGGRFGAGCEVGEIPELSDGNLQAITARVGERFESWLLSTFQSAKQLHKSHENKELFRLWAKVRQEFTPRLEQFLKRTFVNDRLADDPAFYVTGCYFSLTGQAPRENGFVIGAIDKAKSFSRLANWSERRISGDNLRSMFASLLFLATLGLNAGAIWLIWKPL